VFLGHRKVIMATHTPTLDEATGAEQSGTRMAEYESACKAGGRGEAIRDVLGHVGDKWTLLIVGALAVGVRLRFTELQRHIPGISQRMLTVTLRHLERDGLVRRTMYAEVPPRVEYELTDIGTTLIEPARALGRWATSSYVTVLGSRERFDAAIPESKTARRSRR
jgi:DNA-binding HxlR family transcriptional regulator